MANYAAESTSLKAARISVLAGLLFIVLLVLLHFIKPELDPSWRFISEYQLGEYGWMMFLAFLSLALSSLSLGVSLWSQVRNLGGRIGSIMLFITTLGMMMAAFFVTDPITSGEETFHGKIHQLGATLDMIPFAAVFITINLPRKNGLWKDARWKLIWATAAVWIAEIAFMVSLAVFFPADGKFGPEVLVGWPGRISIVFQSAWLILIARHVITLNARPATIL